MATLFLCTRNAVLAGSLRDILEKQKGHELVIAQELAPLRSARRSRPWTPAIIDARMLDESEMELDRGALLQDHTLLLIPALDPSEESYRAKVGELRKSSLPIQSYDLLPKVEMIVRIAGLESELAELRQVEPNKDILETATARLVEAENLAAVGRVVTGIAHEISNQVAISGYAQAIKSRVEPQSELYEFADAIAVSQRRLATMVDQIRNFTSAEANLGEAEPATLAAVVEEALTIFRYDAEASRRQLHCRFHSRPLVLLKRDSFDQIIVNLVSNAVLATKPGDEITIELSEDLDEKMAVLQIKDKGQGMTEEVVKRLGEPFFTTRGDRGSGLGVGICMSIAKAHGGRITFDSKPGVGTTAELRIPLLPEDQGR